MFHKMATSVTDYCLTNKWIAPTETEWSIYVVEQKIEFLFFILYSLFFAQVRYAPLPEHSGMRFYLFCPIMQSEDEWEDFILVRHYYVR